MRVVGAVEAKHRLGQLLDDVAPGEEIMITRRGDAVARRVPVRAVHRRIEAQAALQRIRARAESRKPGRFNWTEWKVCRDEDRP